MRFPRKTAFQKLHVKRVFTQWTPNWKKNKKHKTPTKRKIEMIKHLIIKHERITQKQAGWSGLDGARQQKTEFTESIKKRILQINKKHRSPDGAAEALETENSAEQKHTRCKASGAECRQQIRANRLHWRSEADQEQQKKIIHRSRTAALLPNNHKTRYNAK